MRAILVALCLTLISTLATARIPFSPEGERRYKAVEDRATTLEALAGTNAYASDGLLLKRVARVTYDVSGGDSGGVGTHGLGVSLPAKSIITRSYLYVVTQFTDSGSGTVALKCEDANNIKTATDITGFAAGTFIEGQSTGASSAFVGSIAAACEVSAVVATATQDAGKIIAFIEYVVGE